MIQSHFSYCICTWCNGNKTALLSLQRTADKFIRMIYNINHRAPANDVMISNEHLTIKQLPNLEIGCFMHKYENYNLPSVVCAAPFRMVCGMGGLRDGGFAGWGVCWIAGCGIAGCGIIQLGRHPNAGFSKRGIKYSIV